MLPAIRFTTGCALAPLLFCSSLSLAQGITPQAGTWVIDEENRGTPGRGLQIEVQDDVLVLYVYGYVPTGEPVYWLAAGRFHTASNELTTDLGEYKDGMALGGAHRSAVYSRSRGQVTIRFSDIAKGEICLPGEECKAISAFNFGFEDDTSQLLGTWMLTATDSATGETSTYRFELGEFVPASAGDESDRATGRASFAALSGSSIDEGPLICTRTASVDAGAYFCRIDVFGNEQDFRLDVQRNAMRGEYYDSRTVNREGGFIGFRLATGSGRSVTPN